MNERKIYLIGASDDEYGVLQTEKTNELCKLSFKFRDELFEVEAADYFSAFCLIREKLEEKKLIPFCYGASLNVYPSGMGRSMGLGLKAYKVELGKQARREDMVDIFDQGSDVIPASVTRQKEYFEQWLTSLGA
jgi:hypothetical protein